MSLSDTRQEVGMLGMGVHVLCVVCCHVVLTLAAPSGEVRYDDIDPVTADGLASDNGVDGIEREDMTWDALHNYLQHGPELTSGLDFDKRQQYWHTGYGKRLAGPTSSYTKRQQWWHTGYGKRNQRETTVYDPEEFPSLKKNMKRQQSWYAGYRKRQQGWHSGYGKRNGDVISRYNFNTHFSRQPFWLTWYRALVDIGKAGKRQQGWHTGYGKRMTEVKRQQGWYTGYGKRDGHELDRDGAFIQQ